MNPNEVAQLAKCVSLSGCSGNQKARKILGSSIYDLHSAMINFGPKWHAKGKLNGRHFTDCLVIPFYEYDYEYDQEDPEAEFAEVVAYTIRRLEQKERDYCTMSEGLSPPPSDDLLVSDVDNDKLVYGLHASDEDHAPVAVVNDYYDAWRLGKNAVAVIGQTLSSGQAETIVSNLRYRPLFVQFDDDESATDAVDLLSEARREVGDPAIVAAIEGPKTDIEKLGWTRRCFEMAFWAKLYDINSAGGKSHLAPCIATKQKSSAGE